MARELSEREINKIYNGDCLAVIKTFPDKSIDCVITSPPYWQLRDYKWDGQWGLEPTFDQYLENLWSLMDEIWRVLKETGTVWINIGDTYGTISGNMTSGNMIDNKIKYTGGIEKYAKPEGFNKCLLLLPHRFAIGCIERGWVLRNDIVWGKRNCMPESVTDRFSKKHEYIFFMVKNEKYYFDLENIRDRFTSSSVKRLSQNITLQDGSFKSIEGGYKTNGPMKAAGDPVKGKNPGDVADFWDIPTVGNSEEHYAAYNDKLIGKPIIAGCPKGGIILDPFCGTGTTGCRAIELGRNFIGIEGSEEYCKIAEKRIKPYLSAQKLF